MVHGSCLHVDVNKNVLHFRSDGVTTGPSSSRCTGGGTSHTEGLDESAFSENYSDEHQHRHPSVGGTAVFFVNNTAKHFFWPPILGGDAHMHTACAVAVIHAWHMAALKIFEDTRIPHFTRDQNGRALPLSLYNVLRSSQGIGG